MFSDNTPIPDKRALPTSFPNRGMRAIVQRARLEHLATTLLRMADALRIPVPVDAIFFDPPQGLWRIDRAQPVVYQTSPDDLPAYRLELARAVARLSGEADWPLRDELVGAGPFGPNEVDVFAMALLLPTTLLAGLNRQQRTSARIATLFQVPEPEVMVRMAELGYISREESQPLADRPTS
jgi:hypothetical protein